MTAYYTGAETEKHRKKEKMIICLAAALFLAFNAGAVCACIGVNRTNSSSRLGIAILCGTLACVLPVLIRTFALQPLHVLRQHEEGILSHAAKNGAEQREGVLSDSGHWVALPGSIRYRILTLTAGEEETEIKIPYEKRDKLPADGAKVRVSLVRGYLYTLEEIR